MYSVISTAVYSGIYCLFTRLFIVGDAFETYININKYTRVPAKNTPAKLFKIGASVIYTSLAPTEHKSRTLKINLLLLLYNRKQSSFFVTMLLRDYAT